MAKSNQVVGFVQNEDGTQTFTIGGQSKVFHPDMVHADLRVRAELHGWRQRIQDKAAIVRDVKTGQSATADQKRAAVFAMIDHLESGTDQWNLKAGGGSRKSEADWVVEALADIQGLSVDEARERIESSAEKAGVTVAVRIKRLSVQPSIALRVAELKAAGTEPDDADDLIEELGDDLAD